MELLCGLYLIVFVTTVSLANEKLPVCGYQSCPKSKPGMLNVHIVPHTHDDVGWLKTVDQYFYGSETDIQNAGVQYILDSVISELMNDPNKRFIYVETAFFWKWWEEQPDSIRHGVKRLVNNGQLEFIGGAWSMNDEAVTHYQSIIDQFTWGFRRLNDTFGTCGQPLVGWQIDPFGHSREMASIFAQLGFDGTFIGRLDFQDKEHRFLNQNAEFIWKGSKNLGKSSNIFTSILPNTYSPPKGFCFDILCDDDPIIDNIHSPVYNLPNKVQSFIEIAVNISKKYQTNNIILTMGEDFMYQNANAWYKNLEKLIRAMNSFTEKLAIPVNVFYSSPSCYLKSVNEGNATFNVKDDDFFPYGSDPHSYWTGYYTSRPTLKYYERLGNNFLQVCKQLHVLADLGPEDQVNLNILREAMGVMQHHDAVSGTEKQHVAFDYARQLSLGFDECNKIVEKALRKLTTKNETKSFQAPEELNFTSCPLRNISECLATEHTSEFVVTIYNPISRFISRYIRLPVQIGIYKSYDIYDETGKIMTSQLVPIPSSVLHIPGRKSNATHELVFKAVDLPPLGFLSYYVIGSRNDSRKQISCTDCYSGLISNQASSVLDHLTVSFDKKTGFVKSVVTGKHEIALSNNFLYYKSFVGNNAFPKNRSSGAYIFRPIGSKAYKIAKKATIKSYKGPVVEEVHQYFTSWLSQVIRLYADDSKIEFEWLVGPIPVKDGGKEVVSDFTSNLVNNGKFYTDSNGREMLMRQLNFRPTYKALIDEPIAGNYYPVSNRIVIKDEGKGYELAVLTDRSQGGSSLSNGLIELMIHRRILHDDGFGVAEALDETAFQYGLVARGTHYVKVGKIKGSEMTMDAEERLLAQENILAPWVVISHTQKSFNDWRQQHIMKYSGLSNPLPKNVQILTLEPWKNKSVLLRLEHILEANEDQFLSKPVTIDVKNIFSHYTIASIQETTLGANKWLCNSARLNWAYEDNNIDKLDHHNVNMHVCDNAESKITLNPMQIRTFIIEMYKK